MHTTIPFKCTGEKMKFLTIVILASALNSIAMANSLTGDGGGNAGDLVLRCFATAKLRVLKDIQYSNFKQLDHAKVSQFFNDPNLQITIHEDSEFHSMVPKPRLTEHGNEVSMIYNYPVISLSRFRMDIYCAQGRFDELVKEIYKIIDVNEFYLYPQKFLVSESKKVTSSDSCVIGLFAYRFHGDAPFYYNGVPKECLDKNRNQLNSLCFKKFESKLLGGSFSYDGQSIHIKKYPYGVQCEGDCIAQDFIFSGVCL